MNRVRPMIAEILSQAEKSDIRISIENHADFPTQTLYDFIEEFDHPLLGMCFDFANCLRVGDSPIDFLMENDLARISMIHVKDVKKLPEDISPVGWWPTVEWGTGDVGVRECLSYLREQGISSLLLVEISNLYHGLDEISTVNHSISFLESAMR